MGTEHFFDEQEEQSRVKAEIVRNYFGAWAGIISGAQRAKGRRPKLGYVDLFAGPGRYKDGSTSTALEVLRLAIDKHAEELVTIFNDRDAHSVSRLREEIARLPGVERLKHQPLVWNQEVGDEIANRFASINTIPLLAFVDPWGYRGLSLKLVNAFLKDWGCDCIFFFNYNRINAGLSNPKVREHMAALFGDAAAALETELEGMKPTEREAVVVEALSQALRASGHRYVLPFCFKSETGARTTHHLFLVTKGFKGYDVMKDVMAKASSSADQGVPSFVYLPSASRRQTLLFELSRPLDELRAQLLRDMAGRTLTVGKIYETHSVDRPYVRRNYKDALLKLEAEGVVSCQPTKRRSGTMADTVEVTFPSTSEKSRPVPPISG